MNTNIETAQKLKQLRTEKSVSQEEVAQFVGVNRSTIGRWENGDIASLKAPQLKKLADFYNVNVLWLMNLDVPREPEQSIITGKRKELVKIIETLDASQLDDVKKFIDAFIKRDTK